MARLKRKREAKDQKGGQSSPEKRRADAQRTKKGRDVDKMEVDSASDAESGSDHDSPTGSEELIGDNSSDENISNTGKGTSTGHGLEQFEHEKDHKPSVQGVRALPSAQELRAIFEASELYQSNAFKLQIDDLLPSISPKTSQTARAPLEAFLMALHEFLMNPTPPAPKQTKKVKAKQKATPLQYAAEPQNPAVLADALLSQDNIAVPFPLPAPTSDTNWTFKYSPPESIVIVGSWAGGLSVKHQDKIDFGVDLAVAIPADIFQEKDYLNDRYFHKRALYLACIAASIATTFNVDIYYESPLDDMRMTSLVIQPRQGSEHDWSKLHACVRIIPVQSSVTPIPQSRTGPTASNLRVAASAPLVTSQTQTTPQIQMAPTPHSNTLLALSRMQTQTAHLVATHNLCTSIPHFASAVRLLRVWANQRGFGRGKRGSVRGWENMGSWWGWVIGWLVDGGEPLPVDGSLMEKSKKRMVRLGRGLSSYQLFRGTLDFLAHHDFEREPVFMKTTDGGHKFVPSSWISTGRPVFIDPTSTINLLENISLGSLELLRMDAAQTLKVLDSTSEDTFSPTFLRDLREPYSRFDVVLRVSLDGVQARSEDRLDILDRGSYLSFVYSSMDQTLRHALGNRTKAVVIYHAPPGPRSTSQSQPSPRPSFDLCLVLEPEHAFRLIDRGPAVDAPQPAIDAFRELWGDKAELRRFADGSIVECAVWDGDGDRAEIPARIVKHILARHFNLKNTKEVHPTFRRLTMQPESALHVMAGNATAEGYKGAMKAFDELVKAIKGMDLPLSLVACLPCAEELRYSSVFAPSPILLARLERVPECIKYMPVYDAVLQFEKSARWPDDLGAIQKLKLAWFETVAREVMSKLDGSHACVAMDALASPVEDGAALEIALPTGYAFRLRIYHDREKVLLEKAIGDTSLQAFQRADAERALAVHNGRFLDSPRHHAAIVNVHHRHAGFSPTVRLVKRWFAAHLLSNSISQELIELLCAYIFLRPDPQLAPNTGPAGFTRAMGFLSTWDWRRNFLAIPLYGIAGEDITKEVALSPDVRKAALSAFEERRARDPGMSSGAWHIATEKDIAGVWWCTDGRGPTAMVADRVTALAKASMQVIHQGLDTSLNAKALFHHPLDGYDFVIHLQPSVLPRYAQNVLPDETVWNNVLKHVNVQANSKPGVLVGFDPAVPLLEDLQRVYGDTIAFFYDYLGGTAIGCSWNPLVRQSKQFRALLGYTMKPVGVKKGQVTLNEDAILCEIGRMGLGLIKEIVKQTS